ncbi:MAG: hypothetical protein CL608_07625 [Anaerolineaceae bacterium]|nr:hypothetical protein [Anaerolineaceae bacterium]
MTHNLKQNLPVLTADEYKLGQVHTVYHREETAKPESILFSSYLMVVNMTIGDDYYVPTTYIDDTRDGEAAVWLTLTHDDIKEKQLTRLPQFVANDQFTEEKLAKTDATSEKGDAYDKVMPLPPNLSAAEED